MILETDIAALYRYIPPTVLVSIIGGFYVYWTAKKDREQKKLFERETGQDKLIEKLQKQTDLLDEDIKNLRDLLERAEKREEVYKAKAEKREEEYKKYIATLIDHIKSEKEPPPPPLPPGMFI